MSIFTFFKKKHRPDDTLDSSTRPAVQKSATASLDAANDSLDEENRRYASARNAEVNCLNDAYDFNTIEGIRNIPVPCQEVNGDSLTGRVEYYLRGGCFAAHRDAGNFDLAAECIKKAHDLMLISDTPWSYDAYMSSISWLHSVGKHDAAKFEQDRVDAHFNRVPASSTNSIEEQVSAHLDSISENITKMALDRAFQSAADGNTDLVVVNDGHRGCCSMCAKYRNRIYSISGKSSSFPQFPSDYHADCLSGPWPFFLDCSEPSFDCDDIVAHSNRPFVDDRTGEEIALYENRRRLLAEDAEKKIRTDRNRSEYFWLQQNLPSLCPKSLSGYSRMKNANSKAYQKLSDEASKLGKVLESD